MKIPMRRLIIFIAAIILAYAILKPTKHEFRWDAPKELEKPVAKTEESMESIIAKLIECESGGNPSALNPKDGDGTDSRGILQFKELTFVDYATRYSLFPHAEAAELPNLWTDKDAQVKVATEMIRRNRNNLYHWKNCSKKNGLI